MQTALKKESELLLELLEICDLIVKCNLKNLISNPNLGNEILLWQKDFNGPPSVRGKEHSDRGI